MGCRPATTWVKTCPLPVRYAVLCLAGAYPGQAHRILCLEIGVSHSFEVIDLIPEHELEDRAQVFGQLV